LNILIVTQYFYPENFKINDLANELKSRGHIIDVLTGIPNYPDGNFYEGYGFFKKRKEVYNGIKIYRSLLVPRKSGSNINLILNYVSFIFGAIFRSLTLLQNKYDIIFVFEPSPITVCIPAIFIKKIKKIPICFWVLDLWPESVSSGGNLRTDSIYKLINPLVKFIYNQSDRILVSSKGFIKSITRKGINKKKITFFPQWAEKIFKPIVVEKSLIPKIPENSFKIMFAGNIGESQDFPSLLKAARILKKNKDIQWIILGSGRKEEWVKEKIKEYELEECFHMLGNHPLEMMPEFYANADCMLFSLKREYIFSITIPAKVQSYLACAKPILGMIDGEASNIIKDAKAGLVCPSESPEALSKNIEIFSKLKVSKLEEFGKNSLIYYRNEFERTMLINKVEAIFLQMINSKS
jgi:glycosyltransferase involved in cell wall biosynthesis